MSGIVIVVMLHLTNICTTKKNTMHSQLGCVSNVRKEQYFTWENGRTIALNKNMHRQWGEKDMLFFCPINKMVWSLDRHGRIHKYKNMPTYKLKRKELPNE
tara:strand:+ start:242 stop:544 length:303 start_codon:yes stop_codon:yes gene_type:complete